jgi:enoyl-CoA hydratase/carnithine racemase
MYQELQYRVEDPLATISFARPDRLNALTNRTTDELKHAVAQAEADERVVAIVLTGEGRGFCAGADLQGLKAIGEGKGFGAGADLEAHPGDASMGPNFQGPYAYLFSVRKPVIAAINGPCAGLGFAIMCFADLRFASDRAVFSTAFSRRGLVAEWGIGWTLPRLVGPAVALDLLFSARRIDAAEAERIGLVNRVLPHDELLPFVRGYVRELADNVSPTSLAVIKRQVWERLEAELGVSLD